MSKVDVTFVTKKKAEQMLAKREVRAIIWHTEGKTDLSQLVRSAEKGIYELSDFAFVKIPVKKSKKVG